jgi:hypothetical protein
LRIGRKGFGEEAGSSNKVRKQIVGDINEIFMLKPEAFPRPPLIQFLGRMPFNGQILESLKKGTFGWQTGHQQFILSTGMSSLI